MTSLVSVGLERIAALHASELPQKDNLCGCFWGAIALRAAGLEDVDQDLVAVEAGTILPAGDPVDHVPPGEEPRRDYRLRLPSTTDPSGLRTGTAAPALARAVERLSDGRLAVVPVAGPWNGETTAALVDVTAAGAPATTLVANIRTGPLWSSRSHPAVLLSYLATQEGDAAPHEWDVGHFVNLAASVRGPVGTLLVVRDSYRSLGWSGYHLQPADAFARALERDDGQEGGVLCIAPAGEAAALRRRLAGAGYDIRHWDNGTPFSP